MKLKLVALLSLIVLGLAGCSADYKSSNANTNSAAPTTNANSSAAPQTAQNNPNVIDATANPTDKTGGTKEGCKCSAVGMACNTKEGEKGCCGGKDGSCSSMKEGDASCCSTSGKDGAACCSTAGKTAMTDHKNMSGDKTAPEKKTETPPTKKS